VARLRVPVQQDHRAALAADEIMQSNSIELGESLGESGGNLTRDCRLRNTRQDKEERKNFPESSS
jgi:hypothetical protein